ncbi:MAG: GTP 3',8-cyclase MoaA [Firmicutes bacterium]|nr:GTP 3',8-cyclase MoaA [Bacillota bacterium]
MKDIHGRNIDYIRISVTDRCNLRCLYCMPEDGVASVGHEKILSFDEIIRLMRISAGLGIKKVKITGGEPLVRKGIAGLIADIKKIEGIEQVTMTTNGILLEENLKELAAAGLDGVNISLDTLSPEKYSQITRREGLEKVLSSLRACAKYPNLAVKINAVTLADYNYDEIESLAALAKDYIADIRFIEIMPVGLGKEYRGYNQDIILERLTAAFGEPQQDEEKRGNGPAVYYKFSGFRGSVGFISALSHSFCGSCNRIRLTSEGFLKSCLNFAEGADLRTVMREGATDEKLKTIISECIVSKPAGHCFGTEDVDKAGHKKDSRRMSAIGG